MGESRDDEPIFREDIRAEWRALVESGGALPGSGLDALSARIRATGNWPEDLRSAPVIIDTRQDPRRRALASTPTTRATTAGNEQLRAEALNRSHRAEPWPDFWDVSVTPW